MNLTINTGYIVKTVKFKPSKVFELPSISMATKTFNISIDLNMVT